MRKLTFLLSSLGGAMAGYAFSNKKLRSELMNAKDAQAAAKILGRHLAADGEVVATEMKKLAREHELDKKVAQGKEYVKGYYKKYSKEAGKMLMKGAKQAEKAVRKTGKKVMKKVM